MIGIGNSPLLKVMIRNNLLEYFRDFTSAFFTFVFPLIFIIIFALSGSSRSAPANMIVLIQDDASSASVSDIVTALKSVPSLNVILNQKTKSAHHVKMDAAGVINFSRTSAGSVEITVLGQPEIASYLETALLAAQHIASRDIEPAFTYTLHLKEPERPLILQLLPAFFGMALLQLGLFGTSAPLLQLRASSFLRQMQTLPLTTWQFIASLLVTRFIIAIFQMIGMFLISRYLLGLTIDGSVTLFILFLCVGALCFVSMGFAVGGYMANAQAGMFLNLIINFLMLAFGGVFVTASTHGWASIISNILPIRYLTDGLEIATTGSPGQFSLVLSFLVLVGWSIVFILFSIKTFRYDLSGAQ